MGGAGIGGGGAGAHRAIGSGQGGGNAGYVPSFIGSSKGDKKSKQLLNQSLK